MGDHGNGEILLARIAAWLLMVGWNDRQGGIAKAFVKDLILPPSDRDAPDVAHSIVAVASSSSRAKSEEFIQQIIGTAGVDTVQAYGSYEELVNDSNVEIVYVATPQSRHYQDVLAALRAGKHVCCEVWNIVYDESSALLRFSCKLETL